MEYITDTKIGLVRLISKLYQCNAEMVKRNRLKNQ